MRLQCVQCLSELCIGAVKRNKDLSSPLCRLGFQDPVYVIRAKTLNITVLPLSAHPPS